MTAQFSLPLIAERARSQFATRSTRRWSSKRRPAPARPPSSINRILQRPRDRARERWIEIVAVTFTEKAAGELKLRLREAARDAAQRGGRRRRCASRGLTKRSSTLEEAHVNTIHGFCAELLRERPVEARVDPLFAVLTEPQADRLYRARSAAWLQRGAERSARRRAAARCAAAADVRASRRAAASVLATDRSIAAAAPGAHCWNGATSRSPGCVRRSTAPPSSIA